MPDLEGFDAELRLEVEAEIEKLAKDYDLSDMNRNDLTLLQRMATLMVRLTSSESLLERGIRSGELSTAEAQREEQRLSTMRSDLLKFQDSLGIARAKREASVEEDPRVLFQDIRARAAKFLEERLCWIHCPKCGFLVCTANFSYPEEANKLNLVCHQCKTEFTITSKDALEKERKNPYK